MFYGPSHMSKVNEWQAGGWMKSAKAQETHKSQAIIRRIRYILETHITCILIPTNMCPYTIYICMHACMYVCGKWTFPQPKWCYGICLQTVDCVKSHEWRSCERLDGGEKNQENSVLKNLSKLYYVITLK